MLYNATSVADYIINYCYEKKNPISNLQLQKILYFAWIEFYKLTGRSLFGDPMCAWQFGPVVPEVYYEYCAYGGRPINIKCETEIAKSDELILNGIIDQYSNMSVNDLVNRTHEKGTPWDIVYKNGEGNRNVIPFQLIRDLECGGQNVSRRN